MFGFLRTLIDHLVVLQILTHETYILFIQSCLNKLSRTNIGCARRVFDRSNGPYFAFSFFSVILQLSSPFLFARSLENAFVSEYNTSK